MHYLLKYFLLWLPMVLIAVLNGTLRDLWYKKYMGDGYARQLSTISLIILFGVYIGIVLNGYPPKSLNQSLKIGMLWLVSTLVFEFGMGIISGKSWAAMRDDYNLLKGRIWLLVLIWILFAPYLFFKFRQ